MFYGKKSWMTETSGENPAWLFPVSGYPNAGAWSLALRIHQALTTGRQSAWIYWQMTDGSPVGAQTLTSSTLLTNSAKIYRGETFFPLHPPRRRCGQRHRQRLHQPAGQRVSGRNERDVDVVILNTSSAALNRRSTVRVSPQFNRSGLSLRSDSSFWQSSVLTITNDTATAGGGLLWSSDALRRRAGRL